MKKINLLVISVVAILLTSCHGGNKTAEDSLAADSLALAMVADREPERLPDTVFESAKAIDFTISVNDSSIDGRLSSLKDLYTDAPGAFTFRKGSKRQADFGGKIDKAPSGIKIDWTFKTAENYANTQFGQWGGGTGWSGQPVYVEWPDSLLVKMKVNNAVYQDFSGKEIIFGSLCGNLYFVDFTTGKPSRPEIAGRNPIKGSVSLDPSLNGNLYVGQGVPVERPFGVFMVNLFDNKYDLFLPEDPKALRRWQAYDSSSIHVGQFQFFPAENGGLYKYYTQPGKMVQHSVLRYRINGVAPGSESSMAVYSNYGIMCDNHGNILCINLDNLKPVWLYRLGDDIDSTPVIAEEDGKMVVYAGCEIDLQGSNGTANFVKLNLLDGSEIWKAEIPGHQKSIGKKHFDGGFYASPLLGQGNCSDKIFTLCVRNTEGQNGEFLAFDRKTGNIVYQIPLKHYAWSSPVAFMTPDDQMYIFAADCIGNIYLIDAKKGEIMHTQRVGNNFESSPVVVGNSLILGTRGNSVFKMSIE